MRRIKESDDDDDGDDDDDDEMTMITIHNKCVIA